MFRLTLLPSIIILLSACSGNQARQVANLDNFYQYQIYSPNSEPITIDELAQNFQKADVILVGEWHTHSGIHRFQTELLQRLLRQNMTIALSMEQFSRDHQSVVDSYLKGEIGEQTLITQTDAWPNYPSDYRPLVELAKQHRSDIIAANAPKKIVRCIGQLGIDYLNTLTPTQRSFVAKSISTDSSPYKNVFMESMHHGDEEQTERQYAAQISWDETMAESIVNYLKKNPTSKVMHIAGSFHIQQGLGIKSSILKRNPTLNVVVITPQSITELSPKSGTDYQLAVLAPPVRYVKMENRMAAYHSIKKRNHQLECSAN